MTAALSLIPTDGTSVAFSRRTDDNSAGLTQALSLALDGITAGDYLSWSVIRIRRRSEETCVPWPSTLRRSEIASTCGSCGTASRLTPRPPQPSRGSRSDPRWPR